MEREKIREWTLRNEQRYRYLLDFYDGGAKLAQLDENAIVLIKEEDQLAYGAGNHIQPSEDYLIMVDNKEEMERLMSTGMYQKDEIIVVYMAYYNQEKVMLNSNTEIQYRDLIASDATFIQQHYDSPGNAQSGWLEKCMSHGMVIAQDQEGLCGFVGLHQEGSIGFLYVLPSKRHRGIAMELEKRMIQKQLEKGRFPYVHVMEHNKASLSLQKKAGMVIDPNLFYWIAGNKYGSR